MWPCSKICLTNAESAIRRLLNLLSAPSIAHEAVMVSGFGTEIAASVGEECFGELRAPIRRLGSPRAQIACAPPLEDVLRVDAGAIASAAASLIR